MGDVGGGRDDARLGVRDRQCAVVVGCGQRAGDRGRLPDCGERAQGASERDAGHGNRVESRVAVLSRYRVDRAESVRRALSDYRHRTLRQPRQIRVRLVGGQYLASAVLRGGGGGGYSSARQAFSGGSTVVHGPALVRE
ncbi:hypothetical protein D3C72_1755310 [compost metagenome]